MKQYTRAHIRLSSMDEVGAFVKMMMTSTPVESQYRVETADGSRAVNARSYVGMIYMSAEHSNEMYLVNETNNGVFPVELDAFRIYN